MPAAARPRIVDAHMHMWDLSRLHYAWLQDDPLPHNPAGDVAPIAGRSYLPQDYASAGADYDVIGTVHVECGLPPSDQIAETAWLERLAAAGGAPSAIVAGAVLQHPDVADMLASQAAFGRVRGVRQILNWHPDKLKTYTPRDLLQDADWQRGFALLATHGLSFDLQIYPGQMQAAASLASRHPDTLLVLNHAGMPTDRTDAGLALWADGMAALAAQPNVAVKISGLAMVDRTWTVESLRPFVQRTVDLFGPRRCMIGSNFPVDSIHGSFTGLIGAYRTILAVLPEADQAEIMTGTAIRLYRLDVLAAVAGPHA